MSRLPWVVLSASTLTVGCTLSFDDLSLGSGGAGTGGGAVTSSTGGGATSSAGGAAGSGGATTTSGSGGGCAGVCAPPPPTGFTGPFELPAGTACPPSASVARLLGTAVAPTQSDCMCELPPNAPSCDIPTSTYTDANCANMATIAATGAPSAPNLCETTPILAKSAMLDGTGTQPGNTQCATAGGLGPPTIYQEPRAQCLPANAGGCADGVCITDGAPICILADGDTSCPASSPYTVKQSLVFATTTCACPTANYDCAGTTRVYAGTNACSADTGGIDVGASCTDFAGTGTYVKFIPQNQNLFVGKCATPPATVGATTVLTACCLP